VTHRPEIRGQRGIVAAGRHYSVAAGTRVLQAGGNAIDAGVATVFAAAVVEISHFGFGGEAPTIIHDAGSGKVVVINGQGPAPRAATPELFAAQGWVDGNGPLAATLPAVMDALALALQHFGTLSLADVMAPAIEYADGFPIYGFLRNLMITHRQATERWDASKRTYYPEAEVCRVGEMFRQPDLAATLRAIVAAEQEQAARGGDRVSAIRAGRDAFYKGDIARRMVDANRAAGGVFSVEDLAEFEGKLEEPATPACRCRTGCRSSTSTRPAPTCWSAASDRAPPCRRPWSPATVNRFSQYPPRAATIRTSRSSTSSSPCWCSIWDCKRRSKRHGSTPCTRTARCVDALAQRFLNRSLSCG
jgi:gamma-glutamyltranspeptidase/glutathione hydrolase